MIRPINRQRRDATINLDGATSWHEEAEVVAGDVRGRSRVTRQSTDNGATRQSTDNGVMRQSTDDGATRSRREDAAGVEGDERGRSRATRQSANDSATRDEGAYNAQGKEDGSLLPL